MSLLGLQWTILTYVYILKSFHTLEVEFIEVKNYYIKLITRRTHQKPPIKMGVGEFYSTINLKTWGIKSAIIISLYKSHSESLSTQTVLLTHRNPKWKAKDFVWYVVRAVSGWCQDGNTSSRMITNKSQASLAQPVFRWVKISGEWWVLL